MVSKRFVLVPALCALAATTLSAQADPDRSVAGGGSFPAGWHVRTELARQTGQPAPLANVKFSGMGDGMHVTVGPAAIYWRDADTASGNYHIVNKITQMQNPAHPESYGIIMGGRNLADSGQTYTYFLVRAVDGMYSIRRRAGYTARPTAVVKSDSAGKATNELSVAVSGGRVRFMVNGKEVYAADAAGLDTRGVVGYRVNHNLDV